MSLKRFRAQFNIPRDIRKDASFFYTLRSTTYLARLCTHFGVINIY